MPPTVALREVRESDVVAFFEHQADPEAAAMAGQEPRPLDVLTARWQQILADETIVARAVTVDGEIAGHVVSWSDEGHREVGYAIGREFWGQGVATAAVRAFLAEITERPLESWIQPHNVASQRVAEKCGFTFDRVDGEYQVYRLD